MNFTRHYSPPHGQQSGRIHCSCLATALIVLSLSPDAAGQTRGTAPQPPPTAEAQAEAEMPAKREVLRQLMKVLGYDRMGDREISAMVASYAKRLPKVSRETWDTLRQKLTGEKLTEALVEIYAQQFSLNESKQILFFYQTTTGQKLATLNASFGELVKQAVEKWQVDMTDQLHTLLNQSAEAQ